MNTRFFVYKIILAVALFCSPVNNVFAQTEIPLEAKVKLDSLWKVFNQAKHDTTRVKTYLDIGYVYANIYPDSALLFYQNALSLAEKGAAKYSKTASAFLLLKAKSLNNIAIVNYDQGSYDKAIEYYLKSLKIDEELGDSPDKVIATAGKIGMSSCYNNIGNVHANQGSYDQAIAYYLKSLKIKEELGDKNGMSGSYSNIGLVHYYQGSYDQAIAYYLKSLKIREELGDKNGMSTCYNNIGNVHTNQSSYDQAIAYYLKSLKIDEELGDKKGISSCYNNIGGVYHYQGSYAQAIDYYLKSLKIYEELGDKNGIAAVYSNIGLVHYYQGSYDKAIAYYLKSLKIREELGDKNGIAMVYGNISNLHITLADSADHSGVGGRVVRAHLDTALQYGNKSLELAREIGALPWENSAAKNLMEAYKKLGNFKKSIEYAEIFITTQDSMFSEEKTKAIAEMGAKYEAEKRELQIEKLNKEKELQKSELLRQKEKDKRQKVVIIFVVTGLVLIAVFSVFVVQRLRITRRQKQIIEQQKVLVDEKNIALNQQNEEIRTQRDEIEAQRDEISVQRDTVVKQRDYIEEQKKEIDDSIRYAKRIQQAVLPRMSDVFNLSDASRVTDSLGDAGTLNHFIIFRPKDVVSGDFYWAAMTEEWTVVVAADCTGHGVPGAFMSMLGVSFLNEIVRKKDVTNTAEVLNCLRASVIDALKQTGEEGTQKDGMDVSVIALHKSGTHALWTGANNPLWIIRQNGRIDKHNDVTGLPEEPIHNVSAVEEIKPDKMPVAVHIRMDSFTNHEVQLNTGDRLYLFTDGLPDQFGGPKGKKFLYKRFKTILAETSGLTMKEQGEQIEKELDNWMNGYKTKYEQVDDITVVGLMI